MGLIKKLVDGTAELIAAPLTLPIKVVQKVSDAFDEGTASKDDAPKRTDSQ